MIRHKQQILIADTQEPDTVPGLRKGAVSALDRLVFGSGEERAAGNRFLL